MKLTNKIFDETKSPALQQSPLARMYRRFRKNKSALWSLRVLYVLVFIALFGDFIANEKPLYCKLDGKHLFPVLKQYAVDLGLATREARFVQKDWNEHNYESVIFPPIPYSSGTLDLKNGNYKSPFSKQKIESWRWRHWLGTDKVGRDVLAGLIAGTRVALLVGLIAMAIATAIGVLLGAIAGYFGDSGFKISHLRLWGNLLAIPLAWFYAFTARSYQLSETEGNKELIASLVIFLAIMIASNAVLSVLENFFKKLHFRILLSKLSLPIDLLIMRSIEVFNSIPGLLLLLAFVAVLEKSSIFYVMAIIGLIRWTGIARFMRAEMLKVRNMEYIEAARALGFSDSRILFRHALPNAFGPVLITIAFGIASAILLESTLSFLGIGLSEGVVTWGKLLSEARRYPSAWWLAVFPGAAIFVAVTIFNLIGEGMEGRRL